MMPPGRVMAGDRLKISAEVWNALTDLLNQQPGEHRGLGRSRRSGSSYGLAVIENVSGADLATGDAITVADADTIPTAAGYLAGFTRIPCLPVTTPTPGRFLIAAEPVATGAIGQAWVSGLAVAKVTIADADHHYADATAATPTPLVSGLTGPAEILWRAAATGANTWCVVRLGSAAAGVRWGVPTAAYTDAATITLDPCDPAGVDNGLANVTVQAGYAFTGADPTVAGTALTIPTTAIIQFAQAADGLFYIIGVPRQVITAMKYDTTTHKIQAKIRYDFGSFTTTLSDWLDITTAVDCTA